MKLAILALLAVVLSASAAPAATTQGGSLLPSVQADGVSTAVSNAPSGLQTDDFASLSHRIHRRNDDSEDEHDWPGPPVRRQPDYGYQPPPRATGRDHWSDHRNGYIAEDAVDALFGPSHRGRHQAVGGGYYAPRPHSGYQHAPPQSGYQHAPSQSGYRHAPPQSGYQHAPPYPGYQHAPPRPSHEVRGHPVPQDHPTQHESSSRPSVASDSPDASDNDDDSPPPSPPAPAEAAGSSGRRKGFFKKMNVFKKGSSRS